MDNHDESAATPRMAGVPVGEMVLFGAIACTMALLLWHKAGVVRASTNYSRSISDLAVQRRAVEAYAVDAADYPRMSYGDLAPYGCPGMRDFHNGEQVYGTLTVNITTPVAYLQSLIEDKVATTAQGSPKLYRYESPDTHQFVVADLGVPPVPYPGPGWTWVEPITPRIRRMEFYFGEYVLWAVGPTGASVVATDGKWVQYDPTNGSMSQGDVFVSQNSARPVHSPAFGRLVP